MINNGINTSYNRMENLAEEYIFKDLPKGKKNQILGAIEFGLILRITWGLK